MHAWSIWLSEYKPYSGVQLQSKRHTLVEQSSVAASLSATRCECFMTNDMQASLAAYQLVMSIL